MKPLLCLLLITLLTPFMGMADKNSPKPTAKVSTRDKGQVVSPVRLDFPVQKSVVSEPIVSSEPIMSSQQGLDSSIPNKL